MSNDAVAVAPDHYRVLLENERVRVLEFRVEPGAKTQMHRHLSPRFPPGICCERVSHAISRPSLARRSRRAVEHACDRRATRRP